MKEYTESEFAAVVNECAAEVEKMLESPAIVDIPVPWWRRLLVLF